MKTPDEIKKALAVHGGEWCDSCEGCPYEHQLRMDCSELMCANALAYIEQLEETISLMKIQMRGDCGCCKHGRDGDMKRCNECLSSREYHPLWEYEGLPEVKTDEQSEMSVLR